MAADWIECVPNFSEGRRSEVIREIETAVAAVPGVLLLDRHSDPDHNRTVLTFAGPPPTVLQAAFESIRTASQIIDLRQHKGTHPRIGAADVVPFVPLEGASLSECADLARQLGRRVGEELLLPVYLYEAAALHPDRTTLEVIRRGGFEELRRKIEQDPFCAPDYGPAKMGPAGAVAIGARPPLVAFNIYLETNNVEIARRIARRIRTSSGGLPALKALGMLVGGQAQVSMNLSDYARTSLAIVFEAVQREAELLGTRILRSEIVGLLPAAALIESAAEHLRLDPESAKQILEFRLADAIKKTGGPIPESSFLHELSATAPTPGGGSAAAHAAAMAAALVIKTAAITRKQPSCQSAHRSMDRIRDEACNLQSELTRLVAEDAIAYRMALRSVHPPVNLPAGNETRDTSQTIDHTAASAPQIAVARLAYRVLELAVEAALHGFEMCIPDAAAAAHLAAAAVRIAQGNLAANLAPGDSPPLEVESLARGAADLETKAMHRIPS